MTRYKSFQIERRKFQKLWENQNNNRNRVTDLKKINLDFKSNLSFKKTQKITLIENKQTTSHIETVDFPNLPEWAVQFIKPTLKISTEEAYDLTTLFIDFSNAKENDIWLKRREFNWWWDKLEGEEDASDVYNLTVHSFVELERVLDNSDFPATEAIPVFQTIEINIENGRKYNEIFSRKKKTQ